MAIWDSLLGAVNGTVLDAFGREVTYLPQPGGETVLRAIFEPARESEDSSPGVYAVVFVRLADLPAKPERGDEVAVDSITYKVFDIEADTSGGVVLRLRQA